MRVITGKYKGRTLVAPKYDARPTLDRTKETLFNILNPLLQGSCVLDLFAGSGQLAIECLSRGAARAVLCDNSREAVAAIKTNFQKIGEKPELFVCDWQLCLRSLQGTQFDLVLVDPPYKAGLYCDVLCQLNKLNLLKPNGVVVCEHAAEDTLPQCLEGFVCYDERKIGSVMFTFYRPNGNVAKGE